MRRNVEYLAKAAAGVVFAMAMAAVVGACAGSGSGKGSSSGGSTGGMACTDNTFLTVLFNPMYSAYDGTNLYQIPSVVSGVDQSQITWSASPANLVKLDPDVDTGGIMITTQGAGTVTITAQLMGTTYCGQSSLTISSATTDQWNTGNQRYNNGVVLSGDVNHPMTLPDGGGFVDIACATCHGATATNAMYMDVAHTPEQTGGFSDQDMINIFTNGVVPDGGYFDTGIVSYQRWSHLHQFVMSADEAQGMVIYLRSLPPTSQDGTSSFGGQYGYPDGGHPGGMGYPDGGHHHGGGPLPDGG